MDKCKEFTINRVSLKDILFETFKGKSVGRILTNIQLKGISLSGSTIDLGSGTSKASYYRYLVTDKLSKLVFCDYYHSSDTVYKLDLEKPFNLNEKFDNVLCFNTLQLIDNIDNVLHESHEILKKGGGFFGSTAFLAKLHPDPNDYWRFTADELVNLFTKHGFTCKKITYIGAGPLIAGLAMCEDLLPKIIRALLIPMLLFLDKQINKFSKYHRYKYPLGYVFEFRKI